MIKKSQSLTCLFFAFVTAVALTGCGGGGGSSGASGNATSGGSTSTASTTGYAQFPILELRAGGPNGGKTSTITSSGDTYLVVKLTDAGGNVISGQVISVSATAADVTFPDGNSALTGTDGFANLRVSRSQQPSSGGAGVLDVTFLLKVSGSGQEFADGTAYPVSTTTYSASLGYQFGSAQVALSAIQPEGITAVDAYGTLPISVTSTINGVLSTATPIEVSFTASCGQVTPAKVTTDFTGEAKTSFTAKDASGMTISTNGCSGKTVTLSASAVGAETKTKTITVPAAQPTNISYVTPASNVLQRIYLKDSGGPEQTLIEFQVVNERGEPITTGVDVTLSMKTLGSDSTTRASFSIPGNISNVSKKTDGTGKVSVPVFSGTVPTNVQVRAQITGTLIMADSSVIAVASGRPVQSRMSMSLGKFAIRGFDFDGSETTVTLSMADRQGNPVPDGTVVNFVTEGGVMIPPTCVTGGTTGNSRCTVNIRSQSPRPTDGRVTILAYAAGEEDFVDGSNGNFKNNIYDCNESFSDLGLTFRDDNLTSSGTTPTFNTGEFAVPRQKVNSSCGTSIDPTTSTGDGVWGAADVRSSAVLVFSKDAVSISVDGWTQAADPIYGSAGSAGPPVVAAFDEVLTTQLQVRISDGNLNSVPTSSPIAVTVSDQSPTKPVAKSDGSIQACAKTSVSHDKIPNSLNPLTLTIGLAKCVKGDSVNVKVETEAGSFEQAFIVP